ncbi:hypothetical protein [Rheinheimera sp.]|uniref:hypothetical protein n=1 Tax=Rheinheimera sp. TaxID=1869214 RepID=UPI003AF642AD
MKWQYLVKVFAQLAEFHGYTDRRPSFVLPEPKPDAGQNADSDPACCSKLPTQQLCC